MSSSQQPVRVGVIGIGNMGTLYAQKLVDGEISGACLAAVCDADETKLAAFEQARGFTDPQQLFESGTVDAVIIVTPHFQHTPLAIAAFKAGLHVLVEKPLAVTAADCQKIIDAYNARPNKDQVFAVMFNMRTNPTYLKLKQLIDDGELGDILRVNWTITNWFRTDAYYRSGGWRATWAGEGGGVLVNQCPHQLDLMQWLFGLPKQVRAFAQFGADHNIEVEDRVTAYLEYENGATGTFITSTGEFPGTDRLEVACDHGKVVIENRGEAGSDFQFTCSQIPVRQFIRTTEKTFGGPPTMDITYNIKGPGEQHAGILKNFAAAITQGEELIAPGAEGLRGVELCNAMLYSAFTDARVDLPVPAKDYADEIDRRATTSRFKKTPLQAKECAT